MGKDKKIDEALKNAQELKNSHSTLDKHVTDKDNEIIKLRQEVEQLKKQKSDHVSFYFYNICHQIIIYS